MAVSRKAVTKNLKVQRIILAEWYLKPLLIEHVHDVYRGFSAKNCSRDKQGQSETRVHLQSYEQMSNKEWLAFFRNIKNKQRLLNLFATYLSADDFVKSSVANTG